MQGGGELTGEVNRVDCLRASAKTKHASAFGMDNCSKLLVYDFNIIIVIVIVIVIINSGIY